MAETKTPQRQGMAGGHGPGGRAGLVEKPKNFWGTTFRLFGYMTVSYTHLTLPTNSRV